MASRTIKLALIDLSGTLHVDNSAIPGAVEALRKLRGSGVPVKFVTNTTKESRNILHRRLVNLGFDISKDEIFSSLIATRETILRRGLHPLLLLEQDAMEDFADLTLTSPSTQVAANRVVVVGLAPSQFHYERLNEAFRLLLEGASLLAIHEGRYYRRPDGLALGPGAFVKGLEYSAGVKADVVGKPTPSFFRAALGSVEPKEAVMIGDDVKDDVAGAQDIGMQGILVRTGKYRKGDEDTISPKPSFTCASFVEAVDLILERNKSQCN